MPRTEPPEKQKETKPTFEIQIRSVHFWVILAAGIVTIVGGIILCLRK